MNKQIKLKAKTPKVLPIRGKIILETVFGNVVVSQNECNEYYIITDKMCNNHYMLYLNALTPFTFTCFNNLLRNIQVQSDLYLERHIDNCIGSVEIN